MGVNYSAAYGYGFEIPFDDAEEIAKRLQFPEPEWGFDTDEFGVWLTQDYGDLSYDLCGNYMSGEGMYIIIEASHVGQTIDMYGWDGSFKLFSRDKVSEEQDTNLREVFERVFDRKPAPEEVGWYMSTTVS